MLDKANNERQETMDKMAKNYDDLVAQVESIHQSDKWREMVRVAKMFPQYDANTVLSIVRQLPNASRVAGRSVWAKVGRSVRFGAQGARIRGGEVFDISQTFGAPMPEVLPSRSVLRKPAPKVYADALEDFIRQQGFTVEYGEMPEKETNGFTQYGRNLVKVSDRLGNLGRVKTLAHELGHVMLHGQDGRPNAYKEVEAEGFAYTLCKSWGVFTEDYSAPYLARWSAGNLGMVQEAGFRVVTLADRVAKQLAP